MTNTFLRDSHGKSWRAIPRTEDPPDEAVCFGPLDRDFTGLAVEQAPTGDGRWTSDVRPLECHEWDLWLPANDPDVIAARVVTAVRGLLDAMRQRPALALTVAVPQSSPLGADVEHMQTWRGAFDSLSAGDGDVLTIRHGACWVRVVSEPGLEAPEVRNAHTVPWRFVDALAGAYDADDVASVRRAYP